MNNVIRNGYILKEKLPKKPKLMRRNTYILPVAAEMVYLI